MLGAKGRRCAHAFTLVELLVVIAIIGTMVGLLLPAVQRSRESSRRSTCLNNIRQLAIAATMYEGRLKRFPGLFDQLPDQNRKSDDAERWTTWAVLLLPDLERQEAFDEYAKGNRPLPGYYFETYVCPSDSVQTREGSANSYLANAGASLPAKKQRPVNGAFINRIYDPKAAVVEGHWKDGRDRTLAFSETANGSPYDIISWNGLSPTPNDPTKPYLDEDVRGISH